MAAYKLTNKAQDDLLSIGRYTLKEWGVMQRNFYLKQLDACFSRIAKNPKLGMSCDFIMAGYRKLPQGRHVIFYKKKSGEVVEIIRVLHKSMDVESNFNQ
ncbi:type II toxin-antitoxin system RelE/ParE family toxin [Mariprofundus ferrooxydans]|nr:type II toxin-antitoxin system RelE/ParE family toxin [Mariprofundus ferrooxydans]